MGNRHSNCVSAEVFTDKMALLENRINEIKYKAERTNSDTARLQSQLNDIIRSKQAASQEREEKLDAVTRQIDSITSQLHKLSQIDKLKTRIDSLRIEQQEDRSNLSETAKKLINTEKQRWQADVDEMRRQQVMVDGLQKELIAMEHRTSMDVTMIRRKVESMEKRTVLAASTSKDTIPEANVPSMPEDYKQPMSGDTYRLKSTRIDQWMRENVSRRFNQEDLNQPSPSIEQRMEQLLNSDGELNASTSSSGELIKCEAASEARALLEECLNAEMKEYMDAETRDYIGIDDASSSFEGFQQEQDGVQRTQI